MIPVVLPRAVVLIISSSFLVYLILYTAIIPLSFHKIQDIEIITEILYPEKEILLSSSTQKPNLFGFTSNTSPSHPSNTTYDKSDDGLSVLCKKTKWVEGLWLHCHSNCGENRTSVCGGLNNARNRVQTCLRLAIDVGASVIIPSATTRDEKELVKTDGKTVCPDVFWNMDYLKSEMKIQCPKMQIRVCDDRSGIQKDLKPNFRQYLQGSHTIGGFRELINSSFEDANSSIKDVSAKNPVVIEYGDTYIGWNYKYSEELMTIRKALFKVLQFNNNLLELSSQVLSSPELNKGEFIGVHLRGENDWPGGFGGVDDQMRLYKEEIEIIGKNVSHGTKTIYVSCGDMTAIQRFREMLEPLGFKVHDKWTLLTNQPPTLARVESLAFDEKGIVEYQVLVQAKFWIGIITSSMSSLIAYAREIGETEDFFETYVFPNSSRAGATRNYAEPWSIKGNQRTKLMVVNGVDIMESFP